MKYDCTGIILAGGKNSRLPGKKKAFHKIGNSTILQKIHDVFLSLFREIIIVVNEPADFAGWDTTVVTDIIPSKCALAGIHAGLFYSSCSCSYITACDTPFINANVIEYIVNAFEPGLDVIIPETKDGLEPLSAVYAEECIPLIENNLAKGIIMIKKFFRWHKVKKIPVGDMYALDPDGRFIFNVNTPEDLERAKQMARDIRTE